MPVIVVAGDEEGAGATTVAVGLAHRLAYAGHSVRVERMAGDERAAADAATFAALEFASSSGEAIDATSLAPVDGAVTVVEAPPRGGAAAASALDASLVNVSSTNAAPGDDVVSITNRQLRAGPRTLPEDRLLAAPTVRRLIEASGAQVLARSVEGDAAVCEHIVVGPIAEDADEPHFRRFPRSAIVTRAEKVDIALAALLSNPRCLILTGGSQPSAYLLDRVAAGRETTLLLAPKGTPETVHDIEHTFGEAAFAGDEKVERIGELMAAAIDDATLSALLRDG